MTKYYPHDYAHSVNALCLFHSKKTDRRGMYWEYEHIRVKNSFIPASPSGFIVCHYGKKDISALFLLACLRRLSQNKEMLSGK